MGDFLSTMFTKLCNAFSSLVLRFIVSPFIKRTIEKSPLYAIHSQTRFELPLQIAITTPDYFLNEHAAEILEELKGRSDIKAFDPLVEVGLSEDKKSLLPKNGLPFFKSRTREHPLYTQHLFRAKAFIFIIDSEKDKWGKCNIELAKSLSRLQAELFFYQYLERVPMLILCTDGFLTPEEVTKRLEIENNMVRGRPVNVMKREDLEMGLNWIFAALHESLESRSQKPLKPLECLKRLGIDPSDPNNETLQSFRSIQEQTSCPFAKTAELWGGVPLKSEEDFDILVFELQAFVEQSNLGNDLDGFCIELPDGDPISSPERLGRHVCSILDILRKSDPLWDGGHPEEIESQYWRFRFAGADFFVATFAPFYPETSSRYAFGAGRSFILLQPELSFLRHNICDQSPVLKATRQAFKQAGRGYHVPEQPRMAYEVVKPLHDDGQENVVWWEKG